MDHENVGMDEANKQRAANKKQNEAFVAAMRDAIDRGLEHVPEVLLEERA